MRCLRGAVLVIRKIGVFMTRWGGCYQYHDEWFGLYKQGCSLKVIAQRYDVWPGTVRTHLLKMGASLRRCGVYRKYALREDAFAFVTNEPTAYWLGFLYADGCVSVRESSSVSVALHTKDVVHLEALKDFLGSDSPVITESRDNCASCVLPNSIRSFWYSCSNLMYGLANSSCSAIEISDSNSSFFFAHFSASLFASLLCSSFASAISLFLALVASIISLSALSAFFLASSISSFFLLVSSGNNSACLREPKAAFLFDSYSPPALS